MNPDQFYPRRARPPLSVPTPPRPMRQPTLAASPPVMQRRTCGFCAKMRKLLRLSP